MKKKIILSLAAILVWCVLFHIYGYGAEPAPLAVQKRGDGSSVMIGTGALSPLLVIGPAPTGNGTLRIAANGTLDIQSGAIVNFPTGFIPWAAVSKTGSSLADLATRSAADLSSGTLLAARMPAMTGDATSTVGTVALTLATVNSTVGTFAATTINAKGLATAGANLSGDLTTSGAVATLATVATGATTGGSTAIPVITFNNKGLVTAVTTAAVVAPAGTLTGTTLASNVVTSSLTTVGTIGTGVWQGTVVAGQYGGTGVANSGKTITLGGNLTTSGAFATTLTATNTTTLTLPTTGTLATLAGSEALTNKTYNGNTWTAGTGTLTIAAGKTVTESNTLTYTGTDGSTVNFGAGGTVLYSGGAYVSSIAGTANRITASAATGAVTLDIAATYVGQTSITTLGTIATGTWQGSIISATYGGTGNGFTAFSGPTTSTKTFTLPNASATILTDNAAVTVAQGGTGRATSTTAYGLLAAGTTATGIQQTLPAGLTTEILVGGGAAALPVWTTATGSGAPARASSPTFVTPILGAATATSINGLAISLTTGTLTINSGKTLTASNTLTLAGTDGTTMTFPSTSATIARTDAANTFAGVQTFSNGTDSSSYSTGAVVLSGGGLGVVGNIFSGGILSLNGQSNTATAGDLRLKNTGTMVWRNAANSANLTGITMTASDVLALGQTTVPVSVLSTTVSTSATTGALIVAGGVGISGKVSIGSNLSAAAWGSVGVQLAIPAAIVYTDTSTATSGTVAVGVTHSFLGGSYNSTNASVTTTDGVNAFFGAGPGSFGNNTVTNRWAIWAERSAFGNASSPSAVSGSTGMVLLESVVGVPTITLNSGSANRKFTLTTGTTEAGGAGGFAIKDVTDGYTAFWADTSGNVSIGRATATTTAVIGTTASTSTTTGALTVGGGIGVAGAGYFGGILNVAGSAITGPSSGTFTIGNTTGSSVLAFVTGTTGNNGMSFTGAGSGGWTFSGGSGYLQAPKFNTKTPDGNQAIRFDNDSSTWRGAIDVQGGGGAFRVVAATAMDLWLMAADSNTKGIKLGASAGDATFTSTTEATTGGAGSITTAGGIYAAKKIVSATGLTLAVGAPISLASGTGTRAGNATLVGGTVTVSNTTVTANTIVILTRKTSGGTIGTSITYTVSAGTSFTINSDNILDTSTFSYLLIENP